MNAGAAVAAGDVLLFLHADSRLPADGIDDTAARAGAIGPPLGALRRGDRRTRRACCAGRRDDERALARSPASRPATRAIFVERALFDSVGGYPDQPLMEDIELSRRLKRAAGRAAVPPAAGRHVGPPLGAARALADDHRDVAVALRLLARRGSGAISPADIGTGRAPSPVTLQVFAKNPVPGHVKTRLAARDRRRRSRRALRRASSSARSRRRSPRGRRGIVDRVELWCAPDADAPAFAAWRERYGVELTAQTGADLGARMRNALHAALAGGSRAILIGTDCPALDLPYLAQAVAALDDHDAVFGPAEDGGYVLVGLARADRRVFGHPVELAGNDGRDPRAS